MQESLTSETREKLVGLCNLTSPSLESLELSGFPGIFPLFSCFPCFSFGFSEKSVMNGRVPVGLYGNGFKSGSMRLGKDAIVFTKNGETMSVGLLSQTFLEVTKAEHVMVPIVTFTNQHILSAFPVKGCGHIPNLGDNITKGNPWLLLWMFISKFSPWRGVKRQKIL